MTSAQMPTRIAMPCPFAGGSGAALTAIDSTEGNTVNFSQGFPEVYGTPASGGGKYVSRGEMNAIGNLASNDLFYHKCGGLNTFDPAFASAIGGYPEGAVLQQIVGYQIFEVISLKDHNLTNFNDNGVDNVWWRYLNKDIGNLVGDVLCASISNVTISPSWPDSGETSIYLTNYWSALTQFTAPKSGYIIAKNASIESSTEATGLTMGSVFGFWGFGMVAKNLESSTTYEVPNYSSATSCVGWSIIPGASGDIKAARHGTSAFDVGAVRVSAGDNVVIGYIAGITRAYMPSQGTHSYMAATKVISSAEIYVI